jgi:hypothetical protein
MLPAVPPHHLNRHEPPFAGWQIRHWPSICKTVFQAIPDASSP